LGGRLEIQLDIQPGRAAGWTWTETEAIQRQTALQKAKLTRQLYEKVP
jgi:hypothetical protein